jgi:threonine dehydrogenase-like Zn-dependent dehydrogenase
LARVEEIGSAVTRVAPGDLVVPMVRRPCPHDTCAACREERQDFCFTGDFTERGIKGVHGFMTEWIVEDQRYLNLVPKTLRSAAVLVEPLTIAEKALIQVRSLQQRLPWACATGGGHCHRAVVLGAGPVGLLGAMALRAEGFQTYVYSRAENAAERARVVEDMGATFLPAEDVPIIELGKIVGNIDLVYEAMGASRTSFEVMQELGTNGIFVFTGVPGRKAPVEVDTDLIMRNLVLKNQIVLGTVNAGRAAFEAAISDLQVFQERWPKALAGLITGRFPPSEYRDLLMGRPAGIKNLIAFSA